MKNYEEKKINFYSKYKLNIFFQYIKKYSKNFCVLLLITFVKTMFSYIAPLFIARIIDKGIVEKSLIVLIVYVLGYALTEVLCEICSIIYTKFSRKYSFYIEKDVKNELLKYCLENEKKISSGEVSSLLNEDAVNFISILTNDFQEMLINILSLISSIVILVSLQWELAIIIILMQSTIIIIQSITRRMLEERSVEARVSYISFMTIVTEIISNIKIIPHLGAAQYEKTRYNKGLENTFECSNKQIMFAMYISSFTNLLFVVLIVVVYLFGGYQVIKGSITIGILVTFLQYVNNFSTPLTALLSVPITLSENYASISNVAKILEKSAGNHKEMDDRLLDVNEIKIEGLAFSYDTKAIFEDAFVNFTKGTVSYIIGESGIGKSTLLKLICGIIKTEEDSIFFDGIPINKISDENLIDLIALVPQEPLIFKDTIRTNITLDPEENINNKLEQICSACMIYDDIQALEDGFETEMDEQGGNLSGGQKNRVCLARALYSSKPILIIDEGTSGLDIKTELKVRENMKPFLVDKIVIIITHSKNFIMRNSNVYTVENGKITLRKDM